MSNILGSDDPTRTRVVIVVQLSNRAFIPREIAFDRSIDRSEGSRPRFHGSAIARPAVRDHRP
jgi:hypothetical protein